MAKRRFGYKGPSRETLRNKATSSGGFDSYIKPQFKRYKIKDGKNVIRVLPPQHEDADYHAIDVFLNYGIGPDNGTYLSLSKHKKGKDPIAEARNRANREGDEELEKALRPRERRLMWIIDRLDEDEGPQLLDAPITLDKAFAQLSMGDEDEDNEDGGGLIDFTDVEKGRDIRFYREGKGLNTKYEGTKIRLLKPSPLSDDEGQIKEWMDYVTENTLPEVLNFYSAEHLSEIFDGSVSSRDDDDDVKPKKRKSRDDEDEDDTESVKPRRRASVTDDEDEDEDAKPERGTKAKPGKKTPPWSDDSDSDDGDGDDSDSDNDNDDREVTKPKRRNRSTDDEDEDEEQEPAPKKGGGLRDKIRARRKSAEPDGDDEE